MSTVSVTTVMPAYEEGDRLLAFLREWALEGLNRTSMSVTALVVDDGSRAEEETRQRRAVEAAAEILTSGRAPHRIQYLRAARNRGKGASIRWGWSVADTEAAWLGFIDADGAVPAREYWRLAAQLPDMAVDALCGSRIRMAGRSVKRSRFRHLQGRAFAAAVERLFHFGFYDTQCGLKFFRASRLRPLLPQLREDRWLLDIEILAMLHAAGARFAESAVDCHERGGSSLVFGVDPVKMAVRLLALRARLRGRAGEAR